MARHAIHPPASCTKIMPMMAGHVMSSKNEEKKPHHETWKARACGFAADMILKWMALCSESTGAANSRPKMSVVPRELMPFFARLLWSCSMSASKFWIVASSVAIFCACPSFLASSMTVSSVLKRWITTHFVDAGEGG